MNDQPAASWEDRLQLAEESGTFTPEDFALAERFLTCAVGERIQMLRERGIDIALLSEDACFGPVDAGLYELGMQFYFHVESDDVPAARRTFALISGWMPPQVAPSESSI